MIKFYYILYIYIYIYIYIYELDHINLFSPRKSNFVFYYYYLFNTILKKRVHYRQYCTLLDQSDFRYFVR